MQACVPDGVRAPSPVRRRHLPNAALRSDRGEAAVLSAVDAVHRLGIHSIPTLFINGRLVCSGAAGAEEVLSALRRARRGAKRTFAPEAL